MVFPVRNFVLCEVRLAEVYQPSQPFESHLLQTLFFLQAEEMV
jgi:hypothetical protein